MKKLILSTEEVIKALTLRDLSDPSHGKHAMQLIMNEILDALSKAWDAEVKVYRESPIVSIEDNYDRLGYPKDGAARDSRYTRYVCDVALLRTMSSTMVPRAMQQIEEIDETLLACAGMAYRRDRVDRVSCGEPHQLDLWRLTRRKKMTEDDLLEMIRMMMKAALPGLEWKVERKVHPYTLNGLEINILSSSGEWVEVGECGIAHPKIIADNLVDPEGITGLAAGMGLDRILMVRKGIPDIRLLRSKEPRVESQMLDLLPYKEVSLMPPVQRDLSIVVDKDDIAEDLGDKAKSLMGPHQEVIESIKILSETSYEELPQAARDRMGVDHNQKNILIRVILRSIERTLTSEECNEYRDVIYKGLHQGKNMELICK
jgi:phenylalanyl-tRNA synthetase alpha chain